jgi:hypothetical protein
MGRGLKHNVQEFNSIKYYKKTEGYYKADYKLFGKTKYMHRDVWEFYNGKIKKGFHVHHLDHDKSNNDIINLQLISHSEHSKLHGIERKGTENAIEHMNNIRPLSKKWHKSEEGRMFHSKIGKIAWETEKQTYNCALCNKVFERHACANKKGFCSPYCQSQYRRKMGLDNERRICKICENSFECDKYVKKKTCSRLCANKAISRSKTSI